MSSDDEARRGLVDLAVLARYRLVNLTAAVAGGNVVPCDPRRAGQLVLAAWCDRPHNDGHTGGGPYLIAVCDNADNLAELAWAATSHEADLHDGDGPYLRWEVGADLERLYSRTATLWHGVETLAQALGIGWSTDDPEAVFRAAADRLALVSTTVARLISTTVARPALSAGPDGDAILAALEELTGPPADTDPARPMVGRCQVMCPREQAIAIAERAGVVRVDVDWRCYLAPHTVRAGQHTVRPTTHGHLYTFTEDNHE